MSDANRPTRAFYLDAIDRLVILKANERDSQRRKALGKEIARLRMAIIDQAFDEISSRTARLQALMADLSEVISATPPGPNVAASLQSLTDMVNTIGEIVGPILPATRSSGGRNIPQPVRVLCIHGVGDHHTSTSWQLDWIEAIRGQLTGWNQQVQVEFEFVMHDDIFEAHPLNVATITEALWKLGTSGIVHGIGDLFRTRRGLFDLPNKLRWTAGMVVQWAESDSLRRKLRDRIGDTIDEVKPDVIVAHSLGSLAAYDTFVHEPKTISGRTFVSLGSQIGNPFVRNTFAGRIVPLATAHRWYHLYNSKDNVFTSSLNVLHENFVQVRTDFDQPWDALNHDALWYFKHESASDRVWQSVAMNSRGSTRSSSMSQRLVMNTVNVRNDPRPPVCRALLVGINEYPDPAARLDGCVNDVFLMSELLQESGFAPTDIRIVLNDRATAAGIVDRLNWLLEDVRPNDFRLFYYSGHGARIPAYGMYEEVDHIDECLVPHDFDWSLELAVTDDEFFRLYSQLPLNDTRPPFVGILDCCHSGGMTRQGAPRVRGLNPPDDIRHRLLEWSGESWGVRTLQPVVADAGRWAKAEMYVGTDGATHRLGRAVPLRQLDKKHYDETRKELNHDGPYMPILLEACDEAEYAYEYRQGGQSFGAFTYHFVRALRRARASRKAISFAGAMTQVAADLKRLQFAQNPVLVCPKTLREAAIPQDIAKLRSGK